jgi:hypothetical protein
MGWYCYLAVFVFVCFCFLVNTIKLGCQLFTEVSRLPGPWKTEPIGSLETSLNNYQSSLRNIPEQLNLEYV